MQFYSLRCPRSSGRLLKHPCYFAGPGPLHMWEPLLYPASGDPPFSRVPPSRESTEGRAGQVARWAPADHQLVPRHSPAAWWDSTWLNPGFRELRRSAGTSDSQGVCLPQLPGSEEAGVGCRGCKGCRQSWRGRAGELTMQQNPRRRCPPESLNAEKLFFQPAEETKCL